MRDAWDARVAAIREDIDYKKAEHALDKAGRVADEAEDDALFAIDFAYAAIEEAEYAVLEANLARIEADELAATALTARSERVPLLGGPSLAGLHMRPDFRHPISGGSSPGSRSVDRTPRRWACRRA